MIFGKNCYETYNSIICSVESLHNYKEKGFLKKNGHETYNYIICSVESLHFIPEDKEFDFTMIDECESIFEQFSGTTATKSNKSYDVLLSLFNRYKKLYMPTHLLVIEQ